MDGAAVGIVRVSILIPTLNRRGYLRETIASALAQSAVDLEVLVSDDGSTDGTQAYVSQVAAADHRVRLITDNPTRGIFENVEHLIRHASGQAYTVLGDDDLLDPAFCSELARPLERDDALVLTFSDHRVIDASGRALPRSSRRSSRRHGRAELAPGPIPDPVRLALRGGVWLGFALYRRSAFPRDVFDPRAGTAADWDFAIRAAQRGGFYYVGGPFGSYRDHGGTASRRNKREASRAALQVLLAHQFVDARHESLRKELLADRAKRHAFQFAATDREASRQSLELYRRLGGGLSAHTLIAQVVHRLPTPVGDAVQTAVSAATDRIRAVERRLAP